MTSNSEHSNKEDNIFDIYRISCSKPGNSTYSDYTCRARSILSHVNFKSVSSEDISIIQECFNKQSDTEKRKTLSAIYSFSSWYKGYKLKPFPEEIFKALNLKYIHQEQFNYILSIPTDKSSDLYLWKFKVFLYISLYINPSLNVIKTITPNSLLKLIEHNHNIPEQQLLINYLSYPFPSRVPFFNNETDSFFYRLTYNQQAKLSKRITNSETLKEKSDLLTNPITLKVIKYSYPVYPSGKIY